MEVALRPRRLGVEDFGDRLPKRLRLVVLVARAEADGGEGLRDDASRAALDGRVVLESVVPHRPHQHCCAAGQQNNKAEPHRNAADANGGGGPAGDQKGAGRGLGEKGFVIGMALGELRGHFLL